MKKGALAFSQRNTALVSGWTVAVSLKNHASARVPEPPAAAYVKFYVNLTARREYWIGRSRPMRLCDGMPPLPSLLSHEIRPRMQHARGYYHSGMQRHRKLNKSGGFGRFDRSR